VNYFIIDLNAETKNYNASFFICSLAQPASILFDQAASILFDQLATLRFGLTQRLSIYKQSLYIGIVSSRQLTKQAFDFVSIKQYFNFVEVICSLAQDRTGI
jgi:hypothetical protein